MHPLGELLCFEKLSEVIERRESIWWSLPSALEVRRDPGHDQQSRASQNSRPFWNGINGKQDCSESSLGQSLWKCRWSRESSSTSTRIILGPAW